MGQLITYCNIILYLSNNVKSVVYGYLTDIGRIIFIRGRFEKGNRLKWTKSPTLDFLNKSETITEGFKHWLSLLLKTSDQLGFKKYPELKIESNVIPRLEKLGGGYEGIVYRSLNNTAVKIRNMKDAGAEHRLINEKDILEKLSTIQHIPKVAF